MLQRTFKSARELGIGEKLHDGLCQTLRAFERKELKWTPQSTPIPNGFNMAWEWIQSTHGCGTVGCILGWAEHFAGLPASYTNTARRTYELDRLYGMGLSSLKHVTVEQAEHALRSYLATGHAEWETAREVE